MKILHSKIYNKESIALPFLILHGLFGMSDNWVSLGKRFAEERPVHLIDLRNHGESFHSDEMNLDLMAEDINQYLKAYDIKKCDIMGHSLGGKVVMSFLSQYEEKARKAIVVDIGPQSYPPHHQGIIKALKSLDFNIDNSRKKIDLKLSNYISEVDVRQFLMKNIERMPDGSYDFRIYLEGIEKNYIGLLQNSEPQTMISTPTLFINGENSNYIEAQDIVTIKKLFPTSEVISIEGAGHWVHAEKPNAFYEIVEHYLDT